MIELRYQNQILQKENRSLKEKLEKAYEFMKEFVIGGINLLEKFMEWIGEKVKDVGRGRRGGLANAKILLQKQDLNGMIKKICSNYRRTHEDKL